jgi:type II secretory ATPase GspE/PulE/Tfp pilus assembly ATPase PilB-like protein
MVGEIRDLDTATAAVQAALTGHLVLSTLHTKNALETIERLVNIGISDFDIASSVDCVIAQRLVRRVCPHCTTSIDMGFTPDTTLLSHYGDNSPNPQK